MNRTQEQLEAELARALQSCVNVALQTFMERHEMLEETHAAIMELPCVQRELSRCKRLREEEIMQEEDEQREQNKRNSSSSSITRSSVAGSLTPLSNGDLLDGHSVRQSIEQMTREIVSEEMRELRGEFAQLSNRLVATVQSALAAAPPSAAPPRSVCTFQVAEETEVEEDEEEQAEEHQQAEEEEEESTVAPEAEETEKEEEEEGEEEEEEQEQEEKPKEEKPKEEVDYFAKFPDKLPRPDPDADYELYEVEIDDTNYCTNDDANGFIWEMTEDEGQGECKGYFRDEEPFFYADVIAELSKR